MCGSSAARCEEILSVRLSVWSCDFVTKTIVVIKIGEDLVIIILSIRIAVKSNY